jgi:gluconolactonase
MKRFLAVGIVLISACHPNATSKKQLNTVEKKYAEMGKIEVLDPALLKLVDAEARVEILAEGFKWSEGPLWIENGKYLLFSDIPPNKVMKWSEDEGLQEYLFPAGYTGSVPRGGEPGSNGLILDSQGRLVMCQHGDRRMARMDATLDKPAARFITLANNYQGKKLNSPNDAVYHSSGDLYFTDPPYGLVKNVEDPLKELDFQGVFRMKKDGELELLFKDLSRPNGIAFSRDEKKLYVANSDVNKVWMVFDVKIDGGIENGKIFYDASSISKPGSPDGMKVHSSGNIFATGPGGVLVFNSDAKLLGRIDVGDVCSNLAFDTKEEYVYITSNSRLVRVKLALHQ